MGLEIIGITVSADNKPEDEIVHLKAITVTNLQIYALVGSILNESNRSAVEQRHFYRLPNLLAQEGFTIDIHTGVGEDLEYSSYNGHKSYSIFLGLDHCIWDKTGKDIELFRIQPIQKSAVIL